MYDEFQATVWRHYEENGRDMPWRDEPTFYRVLVSEIMLQQTQVDRVRTKFAEFMAAFPTVEDLAGAKLSEVLRAWQGLGYNRRAKFLHGAAKHIVKHGQPTTFNQMVELPGVGKNTAGALMNYVYNSPTPFIETNIRTVYFHEFFPDAREISDAEIVKLVEATMPSENAREWFWALMDYGAWLKKQGLGRIDVSKHYKKQPPLAGSVREIRGQIVDLLGKRAYTDERLRVAFPSDGRYEKALTGLMKDGLVEKVDGRLRLTD